MKMLCVMVIGVCWLGLLLGSSVRAAQPRRGEIISVCELLRRPEEHANKRVSVRGAIYVGMENTNISDPNCLNRVVELSVEGTINEHQDVQEFHRKIRHWKMRGFATVTGIFTLSSNSLTPFVLRIEKVQDVTENARTSDK
jgi:hypothetical protein